MAFYVTIHADIFKLYHIIAKALLLCNNSSLVFLKVADGSQPWVATNKHIFQKLGEYYCD